MQWLRGVRAERVVRRQSWLGPVALVLCALTLAACNPEGSPGALSGQPRGATVAFESIDGLPRGQFDELVNALNSEAQSRRLAVMSRESPSAYRVRGYLASSVADRQTTISWVWDVFDNDGRRVLRISGEEAAKGRHRHAWDVADDGMLQRIAHRSMDELAVFLTSPNVAPGTPNIEPRLALAAASDSSPEAAGIFRIFKPHADPAPTDSVDSPTAEAGEAVPLPPRRPVPAVSAAQSPTRVAASH